MRYSAVMSAIFMDSHTVLAVPANELIWFQLLMTFGLILKQTPTWIFISYTKITSEISN